MKLIRHFIIRQLAHIASVRLANETGGIIASSARWSREVEAMSYPTQDKATRKQVKSGWKRIIGLASGWAAHKAKKCMQTCFYCKDARR